MYYPNSGIFKIKMFISSSIAPSCNMKKIRHIIIFITLFSERKKYKYEIKSNSKSNNNSIAYEIHFDNWVPCNKRLIKLENIANFGVICRKCFVLFKQEKQENVHISYEKCLKCIYFSNFKHTESVYIRIVTQA